MQVYLQICWEFDKSAFVKVGAGCLLYNFYFGRFWSLVQLFYCLNQSNRATLKIFCASVCSGRDVAPSAFSVFPPNRRTLDRLLMPVGPGSHACAPPYLAKWPRHRKAGQVAARGCCVALARMPWSRRMRNIWLFRGPRWGAQASTGATQLSTPHAFAPLGQIPRITAPLPAATPSVLLAVEPILHLFSSSSQPLHTSTNA
jgi:hypothetical protein